MSDMQTIDLHKLSSVTGGAKSGATNPDNRATSEALMQQIREQITRTLPSNS